ncbi:FAD-dependent monooxygenase [Devosia sp. A8/3-2]|nr:FAD-dependent monooxygenase [Devosia sp. A8/3-2]
MTGKGRTFYIAGAGISGLTLALALAKFGANVTVLEHNPAVSEVGAGLQISPNARRILDSLGLEEAIAANSLEPTGIDLYPPRAKRPLVTLELGAIMRERFGAPYAVMHRADLADALYKATGRFANIDILFGVRSWDTVPSARGISLSVEDASGQTRSLRGDALIGADGVHSKPAPACSAAHPPPARPRRSAHPPALRRPRRPHRPRPRLGPLRSQLPRRLLSAAPPPADQYRPLRRRLRSRRTPRPRRPSPAAPPPRPRPGHPRRRRPKLDPRPLYTVDSPSWHQGNIGLIGDAAHAMLPFRARGAAMGIEDAAVLAPLLINEPNAEAAFAKFEALRRPRVERVAKVSGSNGKIFHLPRPLSTARNLVIAAQGPRGHLKRLSWLYGHDVQP